MRKVKIMLMSLSLLTIVGGALAFKAKFNVVPLCTTLTTSFGGTTGLTSCPHLDFWELNEFGTTTYYTTDPIQGRADCKYFDGQELKFLTCQLVQSTTLAKE